MWLCPWCWPIIGALQATFLYLVLEADSQDHPTLVLALVLTCTPVHALSKVLVVIWFSPTG